MTRCTATSKRSSEQCRRHAALGRTTCVMHGGASLVGATSPSFRTGRYSKYLPTRLLDRYVESLNDSELLSAEDEVALVDARLAEVLAGLEVDEQQRDLTKVQTALRLAEQSLDVAAVETALDDLGEIVRRREANQAAWDSAIRLIGVRQRLVESERKRRVEQGLMISAAEAMTLIVAIGESVRTHVRDRAALAAISADLARFTGHDMITTQVGAGSPGARS